jgi:heme exporter protein A
MTRNSVDFAIELDGVAQRLGRSWALRGISLRIPAGDLVAVVGHNGSGKTTLLRTIATILRPTRGNGRVFGFDLRKQAESVRGCCSMLTHGDGLYGDLTAAENLEFAQRMAGERIDRAMIADALARVDLTHAADQLVRTFSSGMQRRAALARLLMRRTPLLLLDEPYNSLDPRGRGLVDELLLEVRRRGGAGLVVLHDLDQSGVAFDMTVELSQGRVASTRRFAPSITTEPQLLTVGA